MRKGKYFLYSLKILKHFLDNNFVCTFTLNDRCSELANFLDIPKTSFFDVLRILKNEKYIKIGRKSDYIDRMNISYFDIISLTTKGMTFYQNNSYNE